MTVRLELESIENAIGRLAEALAALEADPKNALIRDAVIQRFVFTYELSHKMLRRYLERTAPDPQAVGRMSFADLIRTGSEQALLRSDWERWREWRQARGVTSHTYNEQLARQVAAVVPAFLEEARHLCRQLRERTARP
ncbi:MAG: nucleotidyltransferase substrate binding protein [Candidatus Lambdaproteobacteria bacterium]|nr:nucleotidyltransferase substrate binding protein [Candidatus Lambdaproteobacteria bacterium]